MNILKNILNLGILLFVVSCTSPKDKYEPLIQEIKKYKELNGEYPVNLKEFKEDKESLCYYTSDQSFNLESVSFEDMYWYNSDNDIWDFLEGDADKCICTLKETSNN